jgi:hypothetical protein
MKSLSSAFSYLVLIVLILSGISQAQEWSVMPSLNQGSLRNTLTGVDALSENEVWTVGLFDTLISTIVKSWTLIEKWDGSSWSIIPSPNPGIMYNYLISVKALASDNIYAVGSYAGIPAVSQMMVLHWNGSTWDTEPTPTVTGGSSLYGLEAITDNDIWAVGDQDIGAPGPDVGTLTLHWNGSEWNVVTSPNVANRTNRLYDVKAVSTNSIWAVGYSRNLSENYRTLIEHWDGSSWNVISSPNVGFESFLYSVGIISSSDIWATGAYNNGTNYLPLFLHWNGSEWAVVNSPAGGNSTSFIDANNGWSVGGLIARWNGAEWVDDQAIIPGDGSLNGLKIISPGNMWAVGRVSQNGVDQTLTMHYSSVIPVELTSFNAYADNSDIILNWQTSTEINNRGFEIYRSQDNKDFNQIAFVTGHGTTTQKQNYSFLDKGLKSGNYSYKLVQMDFNGTINELKIVNLKINSQSIEFSLKQNFPNPFNPTTVIGWQSPVDGRQTLKIYDILGKEISTLVDEFKPAGSYEIKFDANNLPSGVYMYRLSAGPFIQIKKMILMR